MWLAGLVPVTIRPPHPQNIATTLPTVKMIVEVSKAVCAETVAMFTGSKDTGLPHVDGFYLLYKGAEPMMGVPQKDGVVYTVVTVVVAVVVTIVLSAVVGVIVGAGAIAGSIAT